MASFQRGDSHLQGMVKRRCKRTGRLLRDSIVLNDSVLEPTFEPLDLSRHAALCVAFRRDSFVASFGRDGSARFDAECGAEGERYLQWLAERIAAQPDGQMHVVLHGEVIGQLEMSVRKDEEGRFGYINLFYLAQPWRGQRLGDVLHAQAMRLLQHWSLSSARLTVGADNVAARRFYARHGWQAMATHSSQSDVLRMTLVL